MLSAFRFPFWSPYKKKCYISGAYYYMALGVLSIGALPPGSAQQSLYIKERYSLFKASFTCLLESPVKELPFQVLLMKSLCRERCSISRAFFYISFKVPSKRAIPILSPCIAPSEREATITCLSKSRVREPPPPHSPIRATYGERCPFLEPSSTYLFTQRK